MPKFKVYAIASASWPLGSYEADTPEEAEKLAENDKQAEWSKTLCHQCSCEIELGDVHKVDIEEGE